MSRIGAGSYLNTPVTKAIREYNNRPEKFGSYSSRVRGANAEPLGKFGPVNYESFQMKSPRGLVNAIIVVVIVVLIIMIFGYIIHLIRTKSKKDMSYFDQFKAWGGDEEEADYVDELEPLTGIEDIKINNSNVEMAGDEAALAGLEEFDVFNDENKKEEDVDNVIASLVKTTTTTTTPGTIKTTTVKTLTRSNPTATVSSAPMTPTTATIAAP